MDVRNGEKSRDSRGSKGKWGGREKVTGGECPLGYKDTEETERKSRVSKRGIERSRNRSKVWDEIGARRKGKT